MFRSISRRIQSHQQHLLQTLHKSHQSSSLSTSTLPLLRKHQNETIQENPNKPPKLFVVQPRLRPEPALNSKLSEALNLANSLEEQRDGFYGTQFSDKEKPGFLVVQNPAARAIHADTYFGKGTVENVRCHLNAQDEVDAVFVNTLLSGVQQRNLERKWNIPVLDRVGLIIEIFNAHAQTKEAKLQAELAALMYKKSRLVRVRGMDGQLTFGSTGEAQVVSARGRGGGGQGFMSGAGESELQLQRRRILDRRTQLLREIKDVRRTRAVQRAARKGTPTIAIVGYTNAGKSTLVSALSETNLYCDDRLFATVDPKLRGVELPSGRMVLLSDTVGFISDLPVQLVEAFKSTLEEVVEADLLVHVLDSSSPDLLEQKKSVLQVLEQIGVSEQKLQNMIEVWNKIDVQDQESQGDDFCEEVLTSFSDVEEEHLGTGQDDELVSEVIEEISDSSDEWLESGDEHDSGIDHEMSSVGQDDQQKYPTTDEQESSADHEGSSVGQDDQQKNPTTDGTIINSYMGKKSGVEDTQLAPHVKTSAITRVGLQELLELIDEKLKDGDVALPYSGDNDGILHRKWRPSESENTGEAVGN